LGLKDLKSLAEEFRRVADEKSDLNELAHDTKEAYPDDFAVLELCDRMTSAKSGAAVRVIADEIKCRVE
jgi:hypothetical protein